MVSGLPAKLILTASNLNISTVCANLKHVSPKTKTKSEEKHVLQCTNFAKTLSHINFQVVNGNHLQYKASQFLQLAIHLFYRFHIQTQHFKILRLKNTQKILIFPKFHGDLKSFHASLAAR